MIGEKMDYRVKGLATAGLNVVDYAIDLKFYEENLGFELKTQMGPKACWGRIGDLGIYIEECPEKASSTSKKNEARCTLVFDVQNIEAFHEKMKFLGKALDNELTLVSEPNVRWFRFQDMSGNILEACGK